METSLIGRLNAAGAQAKGTDLGGLLQWAALHLDTQDKVLMELREELAAEAQERARLEQALHDAKTSVEGALSVLALAWCPPIELARDMAGHINLMAGHGDPDYLKSNGMSVRHVDLRTPAPRKKQKATS